MKRFVTVVVHGIPVYFYHRVLAKVHMELIPLR